MNIIIFNLNVSVVGKFVQRIMILRPNPNVPPQPWTLKTYFTSPSKWLSTGGCKGSKYYNLEWDSNLLHYRQNGCCWIKSVESIFGIYHQKDKLHTVLAILTISELCVEMYMLTFISKCVYVESWLLLPCMFASRFSSLFYEAGLPWLFSH